MSRFLDQIRKARQARQDKEDGRREPEESRLEPSEEQLLVPEGSARPRRKTPKERKPDPVEMPQELETRGPRDDTDESPQPVEEPAPPRRDRDLVPDELSSAGRHPVVEETAEEPAPESKDEDLVPDELSSSERRRVEREPDREPAPVRRDRDLMPDELSSANRHQERDEAPEEPEEEDRPDLLPAELGSSEGRGEEEEDTYPSISFSELFPEDIELPSTKRREATNEKDEEKADETDAADHAAEPEPMSVFPPPREREPEPEPEPERMSVFPPPRERAPEPDPELEDDPDDEDDPNDEDDAGGAESAGVFPALARGSAQDGEGRKKTRQRERVAPDRTIPDYNAANTKPTGAAKATRRRRHRLTRDRTGGGARVTLTGPDMDPEYVRRVAKVAPKPNKQVVTFYDARHHVCEEYRLLGKNLLHTFANLPGGGASEGNLGRIVTLTSSVRGEGKTLTSINLAMTLAADYADRVLLVDADLRHPKVHRYMGLPNNTGLNDLVASRDPVAAMEDCIVRTDTGLHLLTSSPTPSNPAPMLDSQQMVQALQSLRTRYGLILLDTPPVLLATDALTLGVKSDGMLFLLRARKTQREQIQEARQRIARLDIRLLGYVMNNVKSFLPRIWSRYYYGNY